LYLVHNACSNLCLSCHSVLFTSVFCLFLPFWVGNEGEVGPKYISACAKRHVIQHFFLLILRICFTEMPMRVLCLCTLFLSNKTMELASRFMKDSYNARSRVSLPLSYVPFQFTYNTNSINPILACMHICILRLKPCSISLFVVIHKIHYDNSRPFCSDTVCRFVFFMCFSIHVFSIRFLLYYCKLPWNSWLSCLVCFTGSW
jgi:hypothetical protein